MGEEFLQVVHAVYPQASGGVELYAWEVAREFGGAMLTLTANETEPLEWGGLRVIRRGAGETARAAWRRAVAETQPRLVVVQHLGAAAAPLLLDLAERGIPYAVFLHDFTALCPTHKLWHRREEPCSGPGRTGFKCAWCVSGTARRGIELPVRTWRYQHRPAQWRTALARAEWLIANSRFARDFWRDEGAPAERMGVIEPLLGAGRSAAAPCVAGAEGPRLLYAGGWGSAKGADLLASALELLPEAVELELAARMEPADQAAMRQAVAPRHRLHFHGTLRPEAMRALMGSCQAVVVPSRWEETFGRVATEAQRLGIAVAATAVGGLPEKIIHGVNGFLATAGDAASLSEAIGEALAAGARSGWNSPRVQRNAELDLEEARTRLGRLLAGGAPGRPAAYDTRLRRMQWNHALAFLLGADSQRVAMAEMGGEEAEAAAKWFGRWGLESERRAGEADALLLGTRWEEERLRREYPRVRAVAMLVGEEVETISLPR